jgi:hypothetical protein
MEKEKQVFYVTVGGILYESTPVTNTIYSDGSVKAIKVFTQSGIKKLGMPSVERCLQRRVTRDDYFNKGPMLAIISPKFLIHRATQTIVNDKDEVLSKQQFLKMIGSLPIEVQTIAMNYWKTGTF